MKIARWMKTTIALVVVTLTTATLEPAAFCKDPDGAQSQEPVVERKAEQVPPVSLPPRPTLVAQTTIPATQTPAVPQRSIVPPKAPVPQQTKGKSKKWIWILAGAGAAGAAAVIARGGGNGGGGGSLVAAQPATITIGAPTVGQPQ